MGLLARRNLFHDKVRFAVTLTGIVFALVLIIIQFGLFLGFTTTTSNNIDHSNADLWVVFHGVGYFDTGRNFSERKFYQVLSTPGVAQAEKYMQAFGRWKRPDGRVENIQVIGFHPGSGLGEPWNVVQGSLADLKQEDSVVVDELYREKLGVQKIGDRVEIGDHRARVAGFTRGIRSFTSSPFVYATFKSSLDYTNPSSSENSTAYILVKAGAGVSPKELQERLRARLADVDVYTTAEFSRKTRFYWMFTTGATNRYLYRVLIEQAVWSAVLGYGAAMMVAHFIVQASERAGAVILMPWLMSISMLFLAVVMCVAAALVSINKVTRIDPAMVFRG